MSQIEAYQQLVNKEIDNFCDRLNSQPPELYDPIKYILSLGGKRMRPLLTLLSCDLFDGNPIDALSPAIGFEVFHNFTLIHDDIMDNAPMRRNKPTVHQKWDSNVAIISGDAMMVKAYELISNSELKPDRKIEVLQLFNATALRVCEGQQLDMNYEKVSAVSIIQYIKMIESKTACLLAASLKAGAIIGNAKAEEANRIYEFGKNIGIAFQIQDDILDVYSDAEKFGKQKGGDIIANKKTFLLLMALELSKLNAYKKEELLQWIHASAEPSQKVEAITTIYDFLNVREIAHREMMSYYDKGIKFLNDIPVNTDKKKNLIAMVDQLVNRKA